MKNKKVINKILTIVISLIIGVIIGYFLTSLAWNTKPVENKYVQTEKDELPSVEVTETSATETMESKEPTVDDLYTVFSQNAATLKVGDTFLFGNYEQDNDNNTSKENIEWIVLYKSNKNSMLLVSKKILDAKPYSFADNNVTWENSYAREFLNKEFYDTAFEDFDKHFIMQNTMSNAANVNYKTSGGNNTLDRVFLLSENQIKRYLKKNENRIAEATAYAKNKGLSSASYWLRTPGIDQGRAELIEENGEIFAYGDLVTNVEIGLRPCIWLKY